VGRTTPRATVMRPSSGRVATGLRPRRVRSPRPVAVHSRQDRRSSRPAARSPALGVGILRGMSELRSRAQRGQITRRVQPVTWLGFIPSHAGCRPPRERREA
jgi:hypothetical protein